MELDKKHPLRSLMKLNEKYLKDLAKRGVKPHDRNQVELDSWRAMKNPDRMKTTQEAMRIAGNQGTLTFPERKRRRNLDKNGVPIIKVTAPLPKTEKRKRRRNRDKNALPKIVVTAPPPEIEKNTETHPYPGSEESQTASLGNKKAMTMDKSMTLQVPVVSRRTARIADKGDRPKKASARQASPKATPTVASSSKTQPAKASKAIPAVASSSKMPPTKTSNSKPTKRKASSEDAAPKTPRKRFRTKSSRRPRKPNPDQEYRSHWDPFISKHRCSKCNQPVDDDNHCYNGHRITPLKQRTKSGELIREMTQEEMMADEQAMMADPYRQEIYDSEDDDRFGRIQEGMYTDDEEEGYQGYD